MGIAELNSAIDRVREDTGMRFRWRWVEGPRLLLSLDHTGKRKKEPVMSFLDEEGAVNFLFGIIVGYARGKRVRQ